MYTEDSALVGPPLGMAAAWDAALAATGTAGAAEIVTAYQTLCGVAGLDANLALAQACAECDWFRHRRWTENHNPAGIGITADAVLGVDFGTAERGIMAHIALLCCHALTATPAAVRAWGVLEGFGYGGFQRGAPRVGDLTGHWATDPRYAALIVQIANQVTGGAAVAEGTVGGSAVVAAARAHIGQAREWDAWNGDHAVSMMCEGDAEDWYTEAGAIVPHYVSAAAAGDAGPLMGGYAPAGAQVFFRGAGWSAFDHTGISCGGGLTISGLSVVTVSAGWQDLSSYRGWRFPAGVFDDSGPAVDLSRPAPGNPYGPVGMLHPFSSRWFQLDALGLAVPMMGWPVAPEAATHAGRRVQQFERGWYGVQPAAAPWDVVALLPVEVPPAIGKG